MGSDISSDSLDSKNDIIIDCTDADIDDEINVNSTNHKSISQFRNKSISSDVLINSLIKRSSSSYSNSPNLSRRRRSFSEGSSEDEYGWFEEIESPARPRSGSTESNNEVSLKRSTSLPIPVSETPIYVLESSIIAQKLWYETAGKRPKQPENERKYFENLWKSNFENSNIEHFKTSEYFISNINDKKSYYKKISDSFDDKEEEIIFKGRVPFSNSVSRSFIDQNFSTITIQMPRFKISRYTNNDCHASFLVIITVGGLAIGVWRRHSDFKNLADKVIEYCALPENSDHYKNSRLSWQCVLHRKQWYRCLDKDYLALKCFLLERFLHDVLFESTSISLLNKFLDLNRFFD